MANKPKVLLMGHTWVKYIQDEHLRKPVEDYELNFAFEEGIRIDGLIEMIPVVLTPEHTHILLFSLLTDALCMQSVDPQPGRNPRYQLIVPNRDFNPEYFAARMNVFSESCKMINPNIKIILMIPPVIDLVEHNRIKASFFPPHIQRAYMANPQFDDRLIYMCMKDLNSTMWLMKTKQFSWMNKRAYPLQYVAQLIQTSRAHFSKFMKEEIYTMGKGGHLCDGFHPNSIFIQKMWNRLKSANVLELPKLPTFKQNNIAPQQKKVNKRKFDSSAHMSEKFDQPCNKITTSNAKKLPLPPTPPQLSSDLGQNEKPAQVNNDSNLSYPEAQATHSKDTVVAVSSSEKLPIPKPQDKTLQLVDLNYMRQEIEKFASFMAGHAHAVGQNLSIGDIKQMMVTVLQEP